MRCFYTMPRLRCSIETLEWRRQARRRSREGAPLFSPAEEPVTRERVQRLRTGMFEVRRRAAYFTRRSAARRYVTLQSRDTSRRHAQDM